MSWVLLTGEFAYKIKKPVNYSFVDLRSPERRAFYCREELRLNRRFTRNLYIEVCEITVTDGTASIAGQGEAVDHAVRMRQFEASQELDRLLADSRIEPVELDSFGRELAAIHRQLPVDQGPDAAGRPETTRKVLLENLEQCQQGAALLGTGDVMRALRQPYVARVAEADEWLERRWQQGHVRECHGDLHSRNVVKYGGRLVAFDCIEFDPSFRWIDVADDVAFLMMDLEARQFPLHAHAFRSGYLAESGDFAACRMLRLYQTHRALVRAKVTALEAAGKEGSGRESALEQHRGYLGDAEQQLAVRQPMLLLMFGLSGSGKTWLAERLARPLDAVHIRSDVERKRLAGLAEQQQSHSGLGQDLYSPGKSAEVYERLADCAGHALAGGYTAIVDAAFQRRSDRARFKTLAAQYGCELRVIHCHAPRVELQTRLADRSRARRDASEADREVLAWQERHLEPLQVSEGLATVDADTTAENVADDVRHSLLRNP
jgi:aminoglycoside phosphotransferase family enzyme/predicted kinase